MTKAKTSIALGFFLLVLISSTCMASVGVDWLDQYSYAETLVGYVQKHTDDPEAYLAEYDAIWGDLTREHGDIVFDTLTPEQQALVHYPMLTETVWYVERTGKSYHATPLCYTLLRSTRINTIGLEDAVELGLQPCSKCVGDNYQQDGAP